MGRKIGGGVLILIGAFALFLAIKAVAMAPGQNKELEDAVFITDGKVDPENEGKLVMVLVDDLSDYICAFDDEFALSFHALVARRHVEELQSQAYGALKWVPLYEGADFPNQRDFYGSLLGTEYEIDGELLNSVGTEHDVQYDELYSDELDRFKEFYDGILWFEDYKGRMYITNTDKRFFDDYEVKSGDKTPTSLFYSEQLSEVGARRIRFSTHSLDGVNSVVVVGRQEGNKLVKDSFTATANITTKEEYIKDYKTSSTLGVLIFGFILGAAFVGGGVYLVKTD